MNVICHGIWHVYKPKKGYPGAPLNTLYARRDGDNTDWYEFAFSDKHMKENTVKATCWLHDDTWVVSAAYLDATKLFPANAILLEIEGYDGDDPIKEFVGRFYNEDNNELSENAAS